MGKDKDIVELETASSPAIASLIIQALKFEGIPAFVDGCHLQDFYAISQTVLRQNCVKIQVPKSCLEEAKEVVRNMREAGKLLSEDDAEE